MSTEATPTPEPKTKGSIPTICEAERASGPSGAVIRGTEIDFDSAVERRKTGNDVVVCGDDQKTNRALAQRIEAAVGPYKRGVPHTYSAGPQALPHFQQQDSDREGHTFYETPKRKTVRKQP